MVENKYCHYKIIDFIRDEYFQQWILHPDEETEVFWQEWVRKYPYKKEEINYAAGFIKHLKFKARYPEPEEIEASLQRQWEAIKNTEKLYRPLPRKTISIRKMAPWIAAAAILGFLAWFNINKHEKAPAITVLTEEEVKTVMLPDSSVVILNSNSSLSYEKGFNEEEKRELWLKGEAFFKIKHTSINEQTPSPLIVHTQNLDVAVLGTQFNVKNGMGFIDIVLNKGKVKVTLEDSGRKPIYLKPCEFFRFTPANQKIERKIVIPDLYTSWKDGKITLDKVPLSKITQMIEDVYGDSVTIVNNKLAKTKISGTLQVKNEQTLLETLAFILSVDIKKENHHLIFISKSTS